MILDSTQVKQPIKNVSFTKVTFKPELDRFKIDSLSDDMVGLFSRRVVDMCGTIKQRIKVFLNGNELK